MTREIQMEDFRLALLAIWKSKIIIIFATLAGLFAGLFYTADASNQLYYAASSSVYCAVNNTSQTSLSLNSVINYSDVITSNKVCEYAASLIKETALSAEEIQQMLYITNNSNSYVIKITAYNGDPVTAMKITNAVAEAFTSEMVNITNSNSVQILDSANSSIPQSSGNVNKTRLYFVMLGFALSCGVVGIRSLLSDKIRSIAQCVEDKEEILGIVPFIN